MVISIVLAVDAPAAGAKTVPALAAVAVPNIPTNTVSLASFGVGDGRTLNTAAFERALAALAGQAGGRLVVPPGIWLTGPVKLRSRT